MGDSIKHVIFVFLQEEIGVKKKEKLWSWVQAGGDNRNSLPPAFFSLAMIASEAEK